MKMTTGLSMLAVGTLVFLFGVSDAAAQTRRAVAPGAGTAAAAAVKENVVIRKMEATGPNAKVKTPEIKNDSSEPQSQSKDWARITVQYETDAEWTDELVFNYMVMVKNPKTSDLTMFPGSVTYVDIPKGKRHTSTVFLRPTTVERYGNVEWAGVKIYIRGEQVATDQIPDDKRPWTANVKSKENVLLNRAQTPFALVAIDNYETIKPK